VQQLKEVLLGYAPVLFTNIRLGLKSIPGTNTTNKHFTLLGPFVSKKENKVLRIQPWSLSQSEEV
jgi:hypothetical protein